MRKVLLIFFVYSYLGTGVIYANKVNYTIFSLIHDVQQDEDIQHILILKKSSEPFCKEFGENFIKELSLTIQKPVIILSESSSFFLKRKFSSNIIAVVYLTLESNSLILRRMVENLRQMTTSKIIFILNQTSKEKDVLKELFTFCWKSNVINVLAVFCDFSSTGTLFRYTHFPKFEIEELQAKQQLPAGGYYPNLLRDLKGHTIRTIYGGAEPTFIYSPKTNGEELIAGYVPPLFISLAKKHNAILHAPKLSKLLPGPKLMDFALNKSVDVVAAVTVPEVPMDGFTYPYEIIDLCLVLPIEQSIPASEIYYIVFQGNTLLLTIGIVSLLSTVLELSKWMSGRKTNMVSFILNDNCLRGVLGQTFTEIHNASVQIRFIYLLICLLGIILTTSYNSYLQTYLTGPPSQNKIQTFEDLLASGIKVYCFKDEHTQLSQGDDRFNKKYLEIFTFEKSYTKYLEVRDTFSTKYAYMANTNKWIILNERQKIFKKPLFRRPEKMYFFKMVPLAFFMQENSIYMNILNFLILETHSSGLLDYWRRKTLNELIEVGRFKIADSTLKPVFEPMKVGDLEMIWIGLGVAWLSATLCFLMETQIIKWKRPE